MVVGIEDERNFEGCFRDYKRKHCQFEDQSNIWQRLAWSCLKRICCKSCFEILDKILISTKPSFFDKLGQIEITKVQRKIYEHLIQFHSSAKWTAPILQWSN